KVAEAFWGDPDEKVQFNAGHTFAGNPLSCATGLAVLDYIEQRHLLEHIAKTGPYLADKLRGLKAQFPTITDVRGIGMWWGVEFQQNNPTGNSRDDIGKRIERAARERGLIVRGAPDMISVAPPLTMTVEQIDDLVARLIVAISDILG
ncbi:MAG: aminotransferase class III-fold pyridoxal phosphate-dependent enzyme, partial [Chloroflexota bacterium]